MGYYVSLHTRIKYSNMNGIGCAIISEEGDKVQNFFAASQTTKVLLQSILCMLVFKDNHIILIYTNI